MNPKKENRILAKDLCMDKDSRISHKNNNVLVVGSPGTQKTLSYVLPNILNTYSESWSLSMLREISSRKPQGS